MLAHSHELRLFLTAEGELSSNPAWQIMQPAGLSLVEGTARLSMQLMGRERMVIDPVKAAQPTVKSAELLRAMKEGMQVNQRLRGWG